MPKKFPDCFRELERIDRDRAERHSGTGAAELNKEYREAATVALDAMVLEEQPGPKRTIMPTTEFEREAMRMLHKSGLTMTAIAEKLGRSLGTVSDAIHRRTYRKGE